MREVKITCDNCNNDITMRKSMPSYRIEVKAVEIPRDPSCSYEYGVLVHPPIERTYHFCTIGCMKVWCK